MYKVLWKLYVMVFMFKKKTIGKDKGIVGEKGFYILISHVNTFLCKSYLLCARPCLRFWGQCPWNGAQGVGLGSGRGLSALDLKRMASLILLSIASLR